MAAQNINESHLNMSIVFGAIPFAIKCDENARRPQPPYVVMFKIVRWLHDSYHGAIFLMPVQVIACNGVHGPL